MANNDKPHYLMWFRRDLRIHDNTALSAVCKQAYTDNANVTALFLLTPRQWLKHNQSLAFTEHILRILPVLANDLKQQIKINLQIISTKDFQSSSQVILNYCKDHKISKIFANIEYEINEQQRDNTLANELYIQNIDFQRYEDQCILPPLSVLNNENVMYQVFTPFYKKWQQKLDKQPPIIQQPKARNKENLNISEASDIFNICQQIIKTYTAEWQSQLYASEINFSIDQIENIIYQTQRRFPAGETNARHKLDQFIANSIHDYDLARDIPSMQSTSDLAPYLATGSISPRLCYVQAKKALLAPNAKTKDINRWISELAWRDFYRHVLVTKPNLTKHEAYHIDTDKKVSWSYNITHFKKWCQGKTGIPLVDSAMRCLNATGFMHNRLRMVTAMFLTKDLLIDWRWGERYFMQMLIDADFASNNGGWQWSASTGTDSVPYFRIMNPFSQAKTHDKDALFIKKWLPELSNISTTILHDEEKLRHYLKSNPTIKYPQPIVSHKEARLKTIEMFKST